MARMKALSESQRVLELERKLYVAEQGLKQRHGDNMKLQVKLEELQMKYTPHGNVSVSFQSAFVFTQFISVVDVLLYKLVHH